MMKNGADKLISDKKKVAEEAGQLINEEGVYAVGKKNGFEKPSKKQAVKNVGTGVCGRKEAGAGQNDTIVAIATARGVGAIGIIRISGPRSLEGAGSIFDGFSGKPTPNRMYYGRLAAGEYRDMCMGVYFRGPKSYTGEDGVELYLHGGPALLEGVVDYLVERKWFRRAEGGEFTARAFANGKVDLTEAEGVLDIINAQSAAEVRGAFSLLSGELKERIELTQKHIIELRAATEAAIDYPEENVEEQTRRELTAGAKKIKSELDDLLATYRAGRIRENGVKIALVGKPNVGKSSLMNALVGYERSIVTDEAGTTRDAVTESYVYRGVRFIATDTAGLRKALSAPEEKGVELSYRMAGAADVVAIVTEAGRGEDEARKLGKRFESDGRTVVFVENKIDLADGKNADAVKVSALGGEGIAELKAAIYKAAFGSGEVVSGAALVNERQHSAAVRAADAIGRALTVGDDEPVELISADLYEAYTELGRITGISGSDALVGELFSKFCVGK